MISAFAAAFAFQHSSMCTRMLLGVMSEAKFEYQPSTLEEVLKSILILPSSRPSRCAEQIKLWHIWIWPHVFEIEALEWCVLLSSVAGNLLGITVRNRRGTSSFCRPGFLASIWCRGGVCICVFLWYCGVGRVSHSAGLNLFATLSTFALPFSIGITFGVCSLANINTQTENLFPGPLYSHCCIRYIVRHMFALQQWKNSKRSRLGLRMVCFYRCS